MLSWIRSSFAKALKDKQFTMTVVIKLIMQIHPAPLVHNLTELKRQIKNIEQYTTEVDIDIVDWSKTFAKTVNVAEALSIKTDIKLNFDLMMEYPKQAIKLLIHDQRVQTIIINPRLKEDLNQQLQTIIAAGKKTGLSINPENDVADFVYLFPKLDLIQIFTVEPGAQNMPFLNQRLDQTQRLRQLGFQGKIGIDGGVNLKTLPLIKKYPIDIVSVGSALSKAEDPKKVYKQLCDQAN